MFSANVKTKCHRRDKPSGCENHLTGEAVRLFLTGKRRRRRQENCSSPDDPQVLSRCKPDGAMPRKKVAWGGVPPHTYSQSSGRAAGAPNPAHHQIKPDDHQHDADDDRHPGLHQRQHLINAGCVARRDAVCRIGGARRHAKATRHLRARRAPEPQAPRATTKMRTARSPRPQRPRKGFAVSSGRSPVGLVEGNDRDKSPRPPSRFRRRRQRDGSTGQPT